MTKRKSELKRQLCINHRNIQYGKALDRLINGEAPPEYVSLRWDKVKEIKG